MYQPNKVAEVQALLRAGARVCPRGGGTKPALSSPLPGYESVALGGLNGMLEYHPGEYTFTALAGTPIAEIQAALAEHGQYLPFDPLFAREGATLGGTLASGLNGPGRYRYGGLRDFILGVALVDGRGELVRGGGKVVKNAAGFDLPKLMVGSLGMFGILVELTFKVFPSAPAHATVGHRFTSLEAALEALYSLYTARIEIDSLDLKPGELGLELWARLAGLPDGLPARVERVRRIVGGGSVLQGEVENAHWDSLRRPPADGALIKVPLTPRRIQDLELRLAKKKIERRYSAGGNLAWLMPASVPPELHEMLCDLDLSGLVVAGESGRVRLGVQPGRAFEARVKQVFDPGSLLPSH